MKTMPAQHPKVPTKPGFRPKLRYRKILGSSLHLFNSIIKPGQVILVYPEDIPEIYSKQFECLDSVEIQEWAKKENLAYLKKENLFAVVEKSHGWYDLINTENGKPFNEKSLRKGEAEELCTKLNS